MTNMEGRYRGNRQRTGAKKTKGNSKTSTAGIEKLGRLRAYHCASNARCEGMKINPPRVYHIRFNFKKERENGKPTG